MVERGPMVVRLLILFVLLQIVTKAQALPSNTLSFQGPASWVTDFRGTHLGYEKRLGNYSALAKVSGYWWDERMSLLDSNDQQILGYSANISGKYFLSLKKMYYVEASGSFTSFNKWLTGEDFHYASAGGFFGRKFRKKWFSIDLNLGFMAPFKSPDQLKEDGIGAHPSVLPFNIFGEIAKGMMKNLMPNSFFEANLAFGYNF